MRITLPSGTAAEVARPGDPSCEPSQGLVVIPDIMGMRPLFDELVQGLADDNDWVVATFEVFPGNEDKDLDWRLTNAGMLDDDRVIGDAVASAEATGCERMGVIGFCMGGMFTLKAAGTGRFSRAVSFYGMVRVPQMWRSETQGEPLDYLARPESCPVLGIEGGADQWVPPTDIDALRATGAEVVVYDGAEHGFVHDPSRPAHRADFAVEAWPRAIAFLEG